MDDSRNEVIYLYIQCLKIKGKQNEKKRKVDIDPILIHKLSDGGITKLFKTVDNRIE